ncbi:hypothetical protein [Duganella sp. Root1480D1]|uniref:hypothetical protein n=1 Tax=Duganella sp. Root1480D1 TaxID=1736471 RepID=UPI000B2544A8|nr:hypothetical protein [Duganella sp. Root1480D1]
MSTEVQSHKIIEEAKRDDKPNRHELVRQQMNHTGLRTGIAAGLLALVGLSAWLLA